MRFRRCAVSAKERHRGLAGGIRLGLLATALAVFSPGGGRAGESTLLWSHDGEISRQATAVLQALRSADGYGLRPVDYDGAALASQAAVLTQTQDNDAAHWADFDHALSSATARFLTDLHFGRVQPRTAGFDLRQPRSPLDITALLARLAQTNDVEATLSTVEPQFYHYRLLEQWLRHYRALAEDATLTDLPAIVGRSPGAGDRYPGAPALRKLLAALGDLPAVDAGAEGATLDSELVAAIRRFQERHGLDVDGVIGKRTWVALTTPLAQRVRQIELTLERWRWLPAFDTPPIIVNIPQFRLYAFNSIQDRVADMIQMPVIVGQTYPHTRTPVFVSEMKFVVFRPYWDVPRSILMRELLPEIRSRPGYLNRNHLEIVRGQGDDAKPVEPTPANLDALASGQLRLRQRPGSDNSLGLIKFMLPNAYNVYLHGTPAHELFKESRRAFSHGCIRVSDPVTLAAHVLRDTPGDWSAASIEAAMSGTDARRVGLPKPITVMVLYGTALAVEDGRILFFEDIYGHDRKLEALIRSIPASSGRSSRS